MPAVELFFWNIVWMSWNAFLALIPFALAIILFRPHHKHSGLIWSIGFIVFLLFLPNTPYLLTDLIHIPTDVAKLEMEHRVSHLAITWQYVALAFLGYWLFCKSYYMFEDYFFRRRHKHHKLIIRTFIFTLISTGIYLGRFPRFNSWDVIAQPMNLIRYLDDLFTPHAIGFIVLFTILLFALYSPYLWFRSKKFSFKKRK